MGLARPVTAQCECAPGTYENGWQEQRAPECVAREMEAWRQACDFARATISKAADQ